MTCTTLSPADFEKAVRHVCLRSLAHYIRADPLRGGDVTAVMTCGALLRDIADEADVTIPQARRQMRALQDAGKVIRDDRRGGSTAWWLVGLAAELAGPPAPAPVVHAAPPRQAVTAASAAPGQRAAWWDVLGVAQDDSFRECTRVFRIEMARLLGDTSPEAPAAIERLKAAYDGAAKAHEVQVTE